MNPLIQINLKFCTSPGHNLKLRLTWFCPAPASFLIGWGFTFLMEHLSAATFNIWCRINCSLNAKHHNIMAMLIPSVPFTCQILLMLFWMQAIRTTPLCQGFMTATIPLEHKPSPVGHPEHSTHHIDRKSFIWFLFNSNKGSWFDWPTMTFAPLGFELKCSTEPNVFGSCVRTQWLCENNKNDQKGYFIVIYFINWTRLLCTWTMKSEIWSWKVEWLEKI